MDDLQFDIDTSIYRDDTDGREHLLDSTKPRKIVGRDDVLKSYRDALNPVVHGEEPDNIFVYGKPGTGKTECTKFMQELLQDTIESNDDIDIDLTIADINCEGISSSYSLTIELINELRPRGEEISSTGYKEKRVYDMLFEELDNIGGTILLILDELDSLDRDKLDGILYQISRARGNGNLENAKVGLIGISNDLTLLDYLETDVKSSLSHKRIRFDPYDSNDLYDVLNQRAVDAFHQDAYSERILRHCAAFGAEQGGDARKAIELLREAGDRARNEGANEITNEHVREAKEQLRNKEVIRSISALSRNEKITLYALVTLVAERGPDSAPRSKVVYERYRELAQAAGERVVRYRTIRDYLKELDALQITHRDGENGGPDGNYRTHRLNDQIELDEAVNELEGIIQMCGVHESISHLSSVSTNL